ncbi:hypothetical protein VPH49_22095 [Pseudomonas luteola]|uniref:hypothetical protein n=1 Tax=Pseudomonas luteola TaxID=47886 RepID=UPI003A89DFEC
MKTRTFEQIMADIDRHHAAHTGWRLALRVAGLCVGVFAFAGAIAAVILHI